MSKTSNTGALGVGTQSAKGTPAASFQYLPALSLGENANQNTQTLQPEIAGSYFPRGAYKAGVSSGGDVSLYMRPDGLGHILFGMCGVDTVSPVRAQSGAYSHVFTLFAPSAGIELPWLPLIKDVSKLYAEQFLDTKVSNVRMDLSKQSVGQIQAGFFGITPSEVAILREDMAQNNVTNH